MTVKQNPWTYVPARRGLQAFFWALGSTHVSGREHFPKSGAVMVVCNHLSNVDPPLLAAVSPRYEFFMAKEELFQVPFVGWFLTSINGFPVKRGTADRAAIRNALAVLAAGEALAMFPEGHRSGDGRLQDGQDGAGLIALRSRAPILPVGMAGTQKMLAPGDSRIHRARTTVRFGPPFTMDDLYDQSGRGAVQEATRRIMAAIEELLPPEHRPAPVGDACRRA